MKIASVFVAALFLAITFFCGCDSKEIKPQLKGISFLANITYYNESYKCDTKIDENGTMHITVNEPSALKGMKVTFSKNGAYAEYFGLKYEINTQSMPFGNITKTVYMLLEDIMKKGAVNVSDGENGIVEGECHNRKYEFHFSPSGLPLMLKIPDEDFKIEFSNVTTCEN